MTREAAPQGEEQSNVKALAELFDISVEDAELLLADPYTQQVVGDNFQIEDPASESGFRTLDESEFVKGRLEYLKNEISNPGHVTKQQIQDNMAVDSSYSRDGDNNQ